jgi:elongation factor 1-alpha
MAEKPHLNLVIIGHVDHGKSTLVGQTLYKLDNSQLTWSKNIKKKQKQKERKVSL